MPPLDFPYHITQPPRDGDRYFISMITKYPIFSPPPGLNKKKSKPLCTSLGDTLISYQILTTSAQFHFTCLDPYIIVCHICLCTSSCCFAGILQAGRNPIECPEARFVSYDSRLRATWLIVDYCSGKPKIAFLHLMTFSLNNNYSIAQQAKPILTVLEVRGVV